MPSRLPHIRHESWPPTQMLLQGSTDRGSVSMEEDPDLSFIDDDPLTYFLTPAPLLDDGDDDENADMMDFEFNAGIEDANHPPEIVRSVSPSALDGLSLPPPKPPTPPRSPPSRLSPDIDSATDEEDSEEYIRLGAGCLPTIGLPFSLRDFAALKARKAAKSKSAAKAHEEAPVFLAPIPSTRGRSTVRFGSSPPGSRHVGGSRGRARSLPGRRRSPHAWREPSPDVWSIEEETEEDINSEMGSSFAADDLFGRGKGEYEAKTISEALEIPAAKPTKRVRFVLPVKE